MVNCRLEESFSPLVADRYPKLEVMEADGS
jgi:hypothetical protein